MLEKMYSPQEVADKLGVCRKTILRRVQDGSIQAVKVGSTTIKIPESAIERFVTGRTTIGVDK